MAPLRVDIRDCRYRAMIGVGGIGSGAFFALHGNHTLGREESRGGHFLDRRDYCKLHILSHYVKVLLGPLFHTVPIGKVGDDEAGHRLVQEMGAAGLDLSYVQVDPDHETLYSVCFLYPDGSGGNLTTDDSACAHVDPAFVARAEPEFVRFEGRGIALAAPEAPLAARAKLFELATAHSFLRVAAFVSAEMSEAIEGGLLSQTDLLAINLDEAAVAAGVSVDDGPAPSVVDAAIQRLGTLQPSLQLTVTAGVQGSWSWDGQSLVHVPALPAKVASTAGAGDAYLAGAIAGLVAGFPLAQAQELGTLVAALSVTSPHTIHPEIERSSLKTFASTLPIPLSTPVQRLLEA
jgi:sugar/nucleoside kinase (ribokinase family)